MKRPARIGADAKTITFTDRNDGTLRYSVTDAEAVQFGDTPYRSKVVPGNYGQPP